MSPPTKSHVELRSGAYADSVALLQVSRDVVAATTPQMGAVQTNRLCTHDFIVPYRFETRQSDNPPCPLGWFFEVSPEQVDRIMQLRPVLPEDGAEQAETPAPPSSVP